MSTTTQRIFSLHLDSAFWILSFKPWYILTLNICRRLSMVLHILLSHSILSLSYLPNFSQISSDFHPNSDQYWSILPFIFSPSLIQYLYFKLPVLQFVSINQCAALYFTHHAFCVWSVYTNFESRHLSDFVCWLFHTCMANTKSDKSGKLNLHTQIGCIIVCCLLFLMERQLKWL